ncbi:MAG: AEC family transporter [Clostridia bacterium]|nr:AEC family transporter [Clostridia bacterium]
MFLVMQQVLLLVLFGVAGYLLCRTGKVKSEHTKILSSLHVYVFLPCTVINTYAANFTVAYIREKYPLLIASVIIIVLTIGFGTVFSKFLTKHPYQRAVYSYSLSFSNYGFFGYPLVESLFGSLALQNAMIFALPISLCTNTFGYSSLTKTKFSLKHVFTPVIWATVIGAVVGLTGFALPGVVASFVNKSAACMAPVGMLLAGMVVSEFDFLSLLKGKNNYLIAALRLLVIPCVIGFSLKLLGLNSLVLTAVMMHAMPCGMNTIVFPRLVGEDCRAGASMTLITSLLAVLTIPFCVMLFS